MKRYWFDSFSTKKRKETTSFSIIQIHFGVAVQVEIHNFMPYRVSEVQDVCVSGWHALVVLQVCKDRLRTVSFRRREKQRRVWRMFHWGECVMWTPESYMSWCKHTHVQMQIHTEQEANSLRRKVTEKVFCDDVLMCNKSFFLFSFCHCNNQKPSWMDK